MHFFFVFKRKKKKKRKERKKNCKFDGPFSVQDPNCFSIFLMRVLHPKLLFGDLSLQIGCGFYTTVCSACLYTVVSSKLIVLIVFVPVVFLLLFVFVPVVFLLL